MAEPILLVGGHRRASHLECLKIYLYHTCEHNRCLTWHTFLVVLRHTSKSLPNTGYHAQPMLLEHFSEDQTVKYIILHLRRLSRRLSSSEVNLPSFFPSSSLSSSPREVGKRRRRLLRKIGVSSENCSTRRRGKGIERERERERETGK